MISAGCVPVIDKPNYLVLLDDVVLGPFSPAYLTPQQFIDTNAVSFAAGMKLGWNLGNTLDTNNLYWLPPDADISRFETAWGNPVTTKENIDTIKKAGFDTIRIPVSWAKAADSEYNICASWMERVTEVVNYAAANDMYIILNTHHDEDIFKFTDKDINKSLVVFRKIWMQIASQFKNYNEKLIFEALNEPRTKGSAAEWSGGTKEEHDNINKYYEVFVNVVRNSGGNNDKRFLMINTYAASADEIAVNNLVLPADTIENKLMVSIHSYAPYNFALNKNVSFNTWNRNNPADTSAINAGIDRVYNRFVSNGIPVVMGEFGAMSKNNEETRALWAEYYTGYARSKGIPCVWWDNGGFTGDGELFGLLNRHNNTFVYPLVLNALKRGAGVQ